MRWARDFTTVCHATIAVLAEVRRPYAVAAVLLYLGSVLLAAYRWRVVLGGLGVRVRYWRALVAYLAGVCVGNVTPARTVGGDACRIAALRTDAPVTVTTTSVVVERLTEVLPVAALVVAASFTLRSFGTGRVWMLTVVGVVLALAAIPVVRRSIGEWTTRGRAALADGLMAPRALAVAVACSSTLWLQDVARLALVAAACGVVLGPSQAAVLSVASIASGLVPTIGGLGAVEGGLIAALVALGVPINVAMAVTALERAISFVLATALGGVAFAALGVPRVWPD